MKAIISPTHALSLFSFLGCYGKDDNFICFQVFTSSQVLQVWDSKKTFLCHLPLHPDHGSVDGGLSLLCSDIPSIRVAKKSVAVDAAFEIGEEAFLLGDKSFFVKTQPLSPPNTFTPMPNPEEYWATSYYLKNFASLFQKLPSEVFIFDSLKSRLYTHSESQFVDMLCSFLPIEKEPPSFCRVSFYNGSLFKKLVGYFKDSFIPLSDRKSLLFAESSEDYYFEIFLQVEPVAAPSIVESLDLLRKQEDLITFDILDPCKLYSELKEVKPQVGKDQDMVSVSFSAEKEEIALTVYDQLREAASVVFKDLGFSSKLKDFTVFLKYSDLLNTLDYLKGKPRKKDAENGGILTIKVYDNVVDFSAGVFRATLTRLRVI